MFDSESQRFFIKSADVSGIPQPLRIFNYVEMNENESNTPTIDTSNFITREEFEKAIDSIKNKQPQQNNGNNNQGRNGNKNGKPSVQ